MAGPHAGKNPAARPGHPATHTDELVTLAHTTVPRRDHNEIGKSDTLLDTAPRCRNPSHTRMQTAIQACRTG